MIFNKTGFGSYQECQLVVCKVPEATLSVNDKTTDSDKVYFNTIQYDLLKLIRGH